MGMNESTATYHVHWLREIIVLAMHKEMPLVREVEMLKGLQE